MRRARSPLLMPCLGLALALLPGAVTDSRAAAVVLNEYNAVGSLKFLKGGDALADEDGGLAQDPYFGRVQGNGGDWFELVVIGDQLDMRGWKLDIHVNGMFDTRLELSNDALWADVRAGTMITIAEDVPADPSYAPAAGDWWIHVQSKTGVPTPHFVSGQSFPVNNDDWQLVIRDAAEQIVFGPAGEGVAPGIGVFSTEVFKLEAQPTAIVSEVSPDYEDGVVSTFGAPNRWGQGGSTQDLTPLRLGLGGPDRDGDGVGDDGDGSGVVGDLPCAPGQGAGCDDNCPIVANPLQEDGDGDGDGDACTCGDAADDGGSLGDPDLAAVRAWLARSSTQLSLAKCGVTGDGRCSAADAAVLARQLAASGPGPDPVCFAHVVPADPTDLLFPGQRVLEVVIEMSDADWDALRKQTRDVVGQLSGACMDGPFPSPFGFAPADVTVDGTTVTNAGIRKKGFAGSLDSIRPSLKIDFAEFVGGQKLWGLAKMTLNNNRQDPANVNQCIGYELFRRAGIPASRCAFAHVVVNGEDLGIYSHVESIKRPFLARHLDRTSGKLYEGVLSDFRGVWLNTFEHKTNSEDTAAADLQALAAALAAPDAQLLAALDPVLDLDAFYTFWAMENLLGHLDGYQGEGNNFWIYFHPFSGKASFVPWGIDTILDASYVFVGAGEAIPVLEPDMLLANRLYRHPVAREAYRTRLLELLDTVWSESFILAEFDRWQALLEPYGGGFVAALDSRRAFVAGRRQQVSEAFGAGAPPWTDPPQVARCINPAWQISGTCTTTFGSLSALDGTGELQITPAGGSPPPYDAIGCGAGPDEGIQSAVTLRIAGLRADGTTDISNHIMLPASMVPGQVSILDDTQSAYAQLTPAGELLFLGFYLDGTVGFSQAGTGAGAPVDATVSADVYDWVPLP